MRWCLLGLLIAVGGSVLGCDTEVSSISPPDLDWQPCECNGLTRGLSDGDMMKLNMYLSRDECEVER